MDTSICNLGIEQLLQYDPAGFERCRVAYVGAAFHGQPQQWFIKPEQAIILSDMQVHRPRSLSTAEILIMQSCPAELYGAPRSGSNGAIVTMIGQSAKYDLIK